MKKSVNFARGFSLVEISIVLVIIGLLFVAVSYGRGALDSAKVANIVATAKDVSSAAKAFREKYKYWPGDLPNASTFITNLPAACNSPTSTTGIGNGAIDTATEISCAIEELFQANLIRAELAPGATFHTMAVETFPVRLVAGSFSNVTTFPPGVNVVEIANLPCKHAQSVDGKLDDGDITTGNAKAIAACTDGQLVPFYAVAAN